MGPYPSVRTMYFMRVLVQKFVERKFCYVNPKRVLFMLTLKGLWFKWLSDISHWENPPILESGSLLNLLC